jgi:SAM-dependent methyltransferase
MEYASCYIKGAVLDLGAGSAKYRDIIKKKADGYRAFDIASGPHIDVVGDIFDMPFENGSFDVVVSTQVLEHVERPWIMIKEIGRILKKDGICIVTSPFMAPYHPDPFDYFRYSKEGLESLFKNEGFEIIESGYYGRFFTVLSEMVRFGFFNRYKKKSAGIFKKRFIRLLTKLTGFLDNFFKKEPLIYANSFIVAKK